LVSGLQRTPLDTHPCFGGEYVSFRDWGAATTANHQKIHFMQVKKAVVSYTGIEPATAFV
jgi:hypothetical protein